MNVLGGHLRPDAGELRLLGQPYEPAGPGDARAAGIAFVHQELNLFPNLSIAENLFLTEFPRVAPALPWIDGARLRQRAAELLAEVGLSHSPATAVARLSAGERQLVEIAKALASDPKVLILDEPTTSLSPPECERLFALMARLRGRGVAILYISHALGDVLRLCDDVVVLRDGERVGGGPAATFTQDSLVALMVGRALGQLYPERHRPVPAAAHPANLRLEVDGVSRRGVVDDISFRLAEGEILGLFGLMGAGRSELARILFGLDPQTSGSVRLDQQPLIGGPRRRIRRGLAFLTEDRRHEGLCLEASIADNLALVTLSRHARGPLGWLDQEALHAAVERVARAVQLSSRSSLDQAAGTLSGGNQQKVVLGKWLLSEPRVLILDEPTRGVDVGARFELYQLIQQHADRGAGVLLISSELEELTGLCDRILVLRQGRCVAEFPRDRFDRESLLGAAVHESRSCT
jgi:ABC-type sugar transport system ATPase subunit